jgi:hypothetical protein
MTPYTKFIFLLIEVLTILLWPLLSFYSFIFSYVFIALIFCESDKTIIEWIKDHVEIVEFEDWIGWPGK